MSLPEQQGSKVPSTVFAIKHTFWLLKHKKDNKRFHSFYRFTHTSWCCTAAHSHVGAHDTTMQACRFPHHCWHFHCCSCWLAALEMYERSGRIKLCLFLNPNSKDCYTQGSNFVRRINSLFWKAYWSSFIQPHRPRVFIERKSSHYSFPLVSYFAEAQKRTAGPPANKMYQPASRFIHPDQLKVYDWCGGAGFHHRHT